MSDGTNSPTDSWQATRIKAAAARHPIPTSAVERLITVTQGELMNKQLSAGELTRLAAALLSDLEEPSR